MMWATVTSFVLLAGIMVARKRAPETKEISKADSELSMILYLAQASRPELNIYFRRAREDMICEAGSKGSEVFVTFFSPRKGIPEKCGENDFRFPLSKQGLYNHIVSLLKLIEYEMPNRRITIHFGWPMSSWLDRFSIGVMMYYLLRLPRHFPHFNFKIDYRGHSEN